MFRKTTSKPRTYGSRALMIVAIAVLAVIGSAASAEAISKSAVFLHCEGDLRVMDGARLVEQNKKIRRIWMAHDGSWIDIFHNGIMRYPRERPTYGSGNGDIVWYYDSDDNNPDDIEIRSLTFFPFFLGLSFTWRQISTNVLVGEDLDCIVSSNPFMKTRDYE